MQLEVIFALIVGITSFLSGCTTMFIFYKKRKNKSNNDVSARLPFLIYTEITLLLWYLIISIPLMLYFWFHFNEYNVIGSTIFILSFIPIYATHIIRIWLLKLKFVITSLSMLNQLGMIKWKEIRDQIWTKIYHKYKWTHNISTLMKISIILNITITAIYLSISLINIYYGIYVKIIVFTALTLCLIIGLFSIKSFNDPFNIFREEIMVLSVWLITFIFYAISHIFLWNALLTHNAWAVTVTFFSGIAATCSILIHFHFSKKSIETELNSSLSPLPIIVSTKEGLDKFLQFLVTELSVENLEFFTLSMRWRHRLVIRDNRRARKRASKKNISHFPFNSTSNANGKKVLSASDALQSAETDQVPNTPASPNTPTYTYTDGKQDTPVSAFSSKITNKRSSKLEHISEMIASIPEIQSTTSKRNNKRLTTNQSLLKLQKLAPDSEANTHLKALPFPILTFEFLDRDVIKTRDKKPPSTPPKLQTENTLTETYVLEFSKTRTKSSAAPQLVKKQTATETVVSVFFEQYDVMQVNRRRMTEMSKTTSRTHQTRTIPSSLIQPKFSYKTTDSNIKTRTMSKTTTGTGGTARTFGTSVTKRGTNHLAVTPAQSPAPTDDLNLDEIDLNTTKQTATAAPAAPAPDPPLIRQQSSDANITLNKTQKSHDPINPITPYHGSMNNSGDMQNSGEFYTINLDSGALKEENEDENESKPIGNIMKQKSITVKIDGVSSIGKQSRSHSTNKSNKNKSNTSTPITVTGIDEEKKEIKPTHIQQDSDHKQIQNTLKPNIVSAVNENNNMFCIVDRLSVWQMNENNNNNNEKKKEIQSNITVNENVKERNVVTFGGWFDDDNAFDIYDKEWTEDFMTSKRVNYDRFITLSEEINISFPARNKLRDFFKENDTVKKFKDVKIEFYDNSLEMAWKDVWQNLNDSLRRFHQSKYYKEWKESSAAHALHMIPTADGSK